MTSPEITTEGDDEIQIVIRWLTCRGGGESGYMVLNDDEPEPEL